jgi:hypothetical protein
VNRAERRRLQRRASTGAQRRPVGAFTIFEGTPVYDGVLVQVVTAGPDEGDGHLLLGIGPAESLPVAYVLLCPSDGVPDLVGELLLAGAIAAEHHPPHRSPAPRQLAGLRAVTEKDVRPANRDGRPKPDQAPSREEEACDGQPPV